MIHLRTAISTLVREYDHLDGTTSASATCRRTAAMEGVTGAFFGAINARLDPYGIDDLDECVAAETLACALFFSNELVAAMLDFRQEAVRHGHAPECFLGKLERTLLLISDSFHEDLFDHLEHLAQDDDDDDGDPVAA